MKSTAPVVTTLAILFALAAPMHARAAIGPAMGGYSAGAVFEGVELASYRWLHYGNEYVSSGAGYRERVIRPLRHACDRIAGSGRGSKLFFPRQARPNATKSEKNVVPSRARAREPPVPLVLGPPATSLLRHCWREGRSPARGRVRPGLLLFCVGFVFASAASAQTPPAAPAAVGVIAAAPRRMTKSEEFLGRVEAVRHVDVVARVSAFLTKCLFTEWQRGQERRQALRTREGPIPSRPRGQTGCCRPVAGDIGARSTDYRACEGAAEWPRWIAVQYDAAIANQRGLEAQVQAAEAQVQASQINLGYTDIKSPIDGKIGRTAVTEGNVVSPSSGVLTTIVSQDPMYVTFPVSVPRR